MRFKIVAVCLVALIGGMSLYDVDNTTKIQSTFLVRIVDNDISVLIPEVTIPETKKQDSSIDETEETEVVQQESVNDDDIMTIASVVEAETKGQDIESKIHIVHVIRNRVNSDKFPNDYYTVCTAGNQFASRWDIEQSTIDAVIQGLSMEDTTHGALFFCLCKETCWLNGTSYTYLFTDIAGHHFWGENE